MSKPIVLPADVFDTFELSCQAYGGIGAYRAYVDSDWTVPLCLRGHAHFAAGGDDNISRKLAEPFQEAAHKGVADDNDKTIEAMIGVRSASAHRRVSWAAYCQQRNIVRAAP